MKTVYAHDYNGIYQGETQAQPHPFMPGEYLMPAYAVDEAPPSIPEGKVAQWSNDAWSLIDDPRIVVQAAEAEQEAERIAAATAQEAAQVKIVKDQEDSEKLALSNEWGSALYERVGDNVVVRSQSVLDAESIPKAWEQLRGKRGSLLSASDFSQLLDTDLTSDEKAAYVVYRQVLRDLPENTIDPKNPVWPAIP